MSARVAEQTRAGINSLPRGQKLAATALGLTTAQAYRYVLLPIAFRIIMPPLTSEFLSTIKNTSVAITIGLIELTGEARAMQEFSFQVFEAFTAATVIYLLINVVVVVATGPGDLLVLVPGALSGPMADGVVAPGSGRRVHLLARHLHHVRGRVFCRDHARRHPVDFQGAAGCGEWVGADLRPDHALRR